MNEYSWSYSAFSSAVKCLQHFKYCYIDGIDAGSLRSGDLVFGSALHSATNSAICSSEDASSVFMIYWDSIQSQLIEYGRFQHEELKELGLNFISKFERSHKKHYEVKSAEVRMYAEYRGIKLEGTADFIGLYKGKKSLRDFKTSGYNYDKDKDKVALQLYLYSYLSIQNLAFTPDTLGYTVFNKGMGSIQDLTWDFSEKDMYKALDNMYDYCKLISDKDIFPKNYNNCLYPRKCEYFDKCHKGEV